MAAAQSSGMICDLVSAAAVLLLLLLVCTGDFGQGVSNKRGRMGKQVSRFPGLGSSEAAAPSAGPRVRVATCAAAKSSQVVCCQDHRWINWQHNSSRAGQKVFRGRQESSSSSSSTGSCWQQQWEQR
jgi:hypothetical protein